MKGKVIDIPNYIAIDVLENMGILKPSQDQIDEIENIAAKVIEQIQRHKLTLIN